MILTFHRSVYSSDLQTLGLDTDHYFGRTQYSDFLVLTLLAKGNSSILNGSIRAREYTCEQTYGTKD